MKRDVQINQLLSPFRQETETYCILRKGVVGENSCKEQLQRIRGNGGGTSKKHWWRDVHSEENSLRKEEHVYDTAKRRKNTSTQWMNFRKSYLGENQRRDMKTHKWVRHGFFQKKETSWKDCKKKLNEWLLFSFCPSFVVSHLYICTHEMPFHPFL